jgi:hypothetical protein
VGLSLDGGILKGHELLIGGDVIFAICGWCSPPSAVWLVMDSSVVLHATHPKSPNGVRKIWSP